MTTIYIVLYLVIGSWLAHCTDEDDEAFIAFVAWPVILVFIAGKFIVSIFRTLIRKGEN